MNCNLLLLWIIFSGAPSSELAVGSSALVLGAFYSRNSFTKPSLGEFPAVPESPVLPQPPRWMI